MTIMFCSTGFSLSLGILFPLLPALSWQNVMGEYERSLTLGASCQPTLHLYGWLQMVPQTFSLAKVFVKQNSLPVE